MFHLRSDDENYGRVTTDEAHAALTLERRWFSGAPIGDGWQPPKVRRENLVPGEAERPLGDFPGFDATALLISERASKLLDDIWQEAGERLPVEFEEGPPYWELNVTNLVDAVDLTQSRGSRFPDGRLMLIDRFVFRPGALEGHRIFKPLQHPGYVLVTDEVAERLEESELEGYRLDLVWHD